MKIRFLSQEIDQNLNIDVALDSQAEIIFE
jgi:hypothetical protein